MPLRLEVERDGNVLELRAAGELDALTGPGLVATVVAALDGGGGVVRPDLAGAEVLLGDVERAR